MKQQPIAVRSTQEATPKRRVARSAGAGPRAGEAAPAGCASERDEMIRQTAYALYEARNREAGHELDDWLQAEAQVSQQEAGVQHS